MRKINIEVLLSLFLAAVLVFSCEDKADEPIGEIDRYEWENTLAGSIVFMDAYHFTGTCTIDGVPIDYEEYWRTVHVGKATDTSISINIWIPFEEDLGYSVNFYKVPVTGELMDIRFDSSVNDADVRILKNGDETYVIQKLPNDFYTVIKLMKNKYNSYGFNKEYYIIDILKLEYLNDLINDDNTTVSFPISSSYIDFNKNKKVKKKLNHIKVDKRIDDFKNLIYFDLNGNVRKQNKDINAYKFVKKVPIRK